MPTTIPDMVVDRPKKDSEMTYLKKKNIDKAVRQKLGKKYVCEINMQKIYNIIVVRTN